MLADARLDPSFCFVTNLFQMSQDFENLMLYFTAGQYYC